MVRVQIAPGTSPKYGVIGINLYTWRANKAWHRAALAAQRLIVGANTDAGAANKAENPLHFLPSMPCHDP
jgi:hypothetical protein